AKLGHDQGKLRQQRYRPSRILDGANRCGRQDDVLSEAKAFEVRVFLTRKANDDIALLERELLGPHCAQEVQFDTLVALGEAAKIWQQLLGNDSRIGLNGDQVGVALAQDFRRRQRDRLESGANFAIQTTSL